VGKEETMRSRHPTVIRAVALVAAATLILTSAALAAPSKGDELLKDEARRLEQSKKSFSDGNKGGSARNIEVVGQHDLGGRGFNGDVWTHDGFAYVGNWGFGDWATGNDRFCPRPPKNGVAVVDATDPANPVDAAIRMAVLGDSSLIARTIADCPRVLCAAPGYLEAHGRPAVPEDLLDPR
jgi:hypothetical protein